ncbi:MAG: hypothetical protein ACT4PJ_02920 [Gemmatimonadaceae bacterium]
MDLDRGSLDFAPVMPRAHASVAPAIYGDQNVNVRLFNSGVVLDSSATPWRWTASVGIRNMRAHHIGDEESSTAPLDTIGLYVFFVQDAVPGQPCTGCVAYIANHDGTLSFDAPNQKFFHWPERLNPMSSPLGDTTLRRRTWIFETSPGVRSFTFNVLVSASWPAPHETRWRVQYPADVRPESSFPSWKPQAWGTGGTATTAGGVMSLRGNANGLAFYYRRDPIAPASNAYIHAVAELTSGSNRPEIALMLSDHVKLIALGVSNRTAGLVTTSGLFISGTTATIGNGPHEFQLRKYAADSVVYLVDGVRRGGATYASLSDDTIMSDAGAHTAFGALPTAGGSNSRWDEVVYEIGATSP